MEDKQTLILFTKPGEKKSFIIEGFDGGMHGTTGDLHGKIEWNNNSKEFIYIPESGFAGVVELTLRYDADSSGKLNKEIPIRINVANTFRPRARLIKIIGQELISNDVIALVELIKNSYDADAKEIDIRLNNIFLNNGEITVKDDGQGMTYEKIINVWLEPATPDKKANSEQTFSKCFKRRFLGEKGIGRFAVHRLGEKIELITRASKNCEGLLHDYETKVTIDWSEFTEEKYLSEIPVTVTKINTPEIFRNSSGTLIRITGIHPWKNEKSVTDAAMKIKGLESPVKTKFGILHELESSSDPGVKIDFLSNDEQLNKKLKETKSLKELLETAFYKFTGEIDELGKIKYSYEFKRIDYLDIKREFDSKSESLQSLDPDWFENHPITESNSPGKFEVSFYAWDLDSATLKVAGLSAYYRNIIKPNAGVRIYRDNFRVWPYGEGDNDWLGLDLIRLNDPKERPVSRNQIFGIIHISSANNKDLKDQSNREGLISNEQYENFYHLVSSALTLFAKERKADKIKIDKVTRKKSVNDIVTESIEVLKQNVETNKHESLYNSDIEKIETSYKDKINDVLERYMMAAAIGISYSIPIHEMKLRLTSINHLIEDLEKHPDQQDKFLKQLGEYVKETEDIVMAVTSIMSRQKSKKISLYKVAQNVEILKESELRKFGVELMIIGDKTIEVEAVPGLLNTAVLNLVDNAIYWLRAKKIKARETNSPFTPVITISIFKDADNKAKLSVKDNGDGFDDPFELLTEPYYSKKSDGLGLGLFLVSEIMMRFNGKLTGYNDDGAVFELLF